MVGEVKNLPPSEIHIELDLITLRLLNLSQEFVHAKLRLEALTKQGQFCLAKSRYTMGGPMSVSKLQLPTEDWSDFDSKLKVSREECLRSEFGVRFNYFSIKEQETSSIENIGSGLVYRGKPGNQSTIKEESTPAKEPIKWFGILVPQSLRQSQSSYQKAIDVSIECANLQNEIGGVIARKKFLTRMLHKVENE